MKHIAMKSGFLTETLEAPDLTPDSGGLPDSVTREQAQGLAQEYYRAARNAYHDGNARRAEKLLWSAHAARGVFGLASAKEVF